MKTYVLKPNTHTLSILTGVLAHVETKHGLKKLHGLQQLFAISIRDGLGELMQVANSVSTQFKPISSTLMIHHVTFDHSKPCPAVQLKFVPNMYLKVDPLKSKVPLSVQGPRLNIESLSNITDEGQLHILQKLIVSASGDELNRALSSTSRRF